MSYKENPDDISNWERFFKWVNGEDVITALWEKDRKKRMAGKRRKRKKDVDEIIKKILSFRKVIYVTISVIITVIYIGILLYTAYCLPEHGNPENPRNNEVSQRYIERGLEETGATNAVAGMILDYRAFDTFGESIVLFTSVMCVAILLKKDKNNANEFDEIEERFERKIIREDSGAVLKFVARLIFPVVVLYGIYVILNGHISPGGGFSGGAIIGAAMILYSSAYGSERVRRFFTYKTFSNISAACLLVYFFSKGYSFFTGGNHIESVIPKGVPGHILSGGLILPLNICVGIVVACTMYGFYAYFTRGDI